MNHSFFEPVGRIVEVEGEYVQVFDFPDEAAARKAMDPVGPDGYNIDLPSKPGEPQGTVHSDWISTPHFFQHATVIALYVGNDLRVLGLLEDRMGTQFAGGPRSAE